MPEDTPTLNHFALFSFKDAYWALPTPARADLHQAWLAGLRDAAPAVQCYQSAESGVDLIVWSAVALGGPDTTARFFEGQARATNAVRQYLAPVHSLWGYTRPSQYTKTRSTQEIEPFDAARRRYLVIYPFVKTTEWYLLGREARQGMMNEHIRIGKQYEDISQLLLYSFGVQDQEFVVVYEMDDLPRFSDLVNELRGADGRLYTLRDTPLHTGIYHPAEETSGAMGLNDRFLRACRREPVDRTPVWFMRQAGRYMPEYRAIRARHSLLEICAQPDLAAEITLQPIEALGVDAAILFADILLPLIPMGIHLEFAAGEGPVIHNPVRSAADVRALRPVDVPAELGHVLAAVRLARRALDGRVPLIGFAGAPFTLASYLIEGSSSRNYTRTKGLMYSEPEVWHGLLDHLAGVVADYLSAQVKAGAQAIQLFDSWAGALSPDDYAEYVLPHSRRIVQAVAATGVPVIHFGVGTATLLPHFAVTGADVIGLDWRTPLDWGWQQVGDDVAVQGNLDPVALFAPRPELERRVQAVLSQAGGRPGHIFNLGHGILPETPVENVKAVVDWVHAHSVRAVA